MPENLSNSVTVITGAASGIGRATALELAREGATVVVASRRADALERLAAEITANGGRALAFPLDVTDESAVQRLADVTVETYGRIDTWINNASVMSFGHFLDTPTDDVRRIFDVNVFGYLNGIRAVLPYFLEQGHGILINVASLDSRVPQPESLPYVASKHAIRSISMNLRQELKMQGADDIHVVTVLPASIDTPLFRHAANYTGKAIRMPRPVYPAEMVADTIIDGIRHPRNELFAGSAGRFAHMAMKIAPGITERMMTVMAREQTLESIPVEPTSGNLYTPDEGDDQVSGELLSEDYLRKRTIAQKVMTFAGVTLAIGWLRRRFTR